MDNLDEALKIMFNGLAVVFLVMTLIAMATWLSGKLFIYLDKKDEERKKIEAERKKEEKAKKKAEKARKKAEKAAKEAKKKIESSPKSDKNELSEEASLKNVDSSGLEKHSKTENPQKPTEAANAATSQEKGAK